ncbi:hypothetical protein CAEBREN_24520 [Caenorhabditis brenneri]|uniref:Ig-like domain-containing protein n=1 Tax=Caenorhabditis brenneri TaxID=135651 RepID=G0N1X8_CAEBE|nr:hypothetical protein CAEBREN_24520 [Caenorhabditis brenneri]
MGSMAEELDSKLTSKPMLRIIKPLDDVTVMAGETVTFQCDALFIPSATIYWEKNGVRVQGDKELNLKEKMLNLGKPIVESGIVTSTLTIPCADAHDSGKYQCIAYTGHSSVKSSAELTVEGRSQCKSSHRAALAITQFTDSRFEMEGNTATLLCRTNQFAERTWTFDEKPIDFASGRYTIQPNGDLVINNIDWPDMGTYICTASNEHGEESVETFLYPTKKKTL